MEGLEQFKLLVLQIHFTGGDEILQTIVELHQLILFHFEDGGRGGLVGQIDIFGLLGLELISHLLSHSLQFLLVGHQGLLRGVDARHILHDGSVIHVAELRLLRVTRCNTE